MKKHSGTAVLKEKYFDLNKMTSKERKCALLMLLNRIDYEIGGFDYTIPSQMGKAVGGIVYRKSTPKPFKFSEMEPGPDFYYPLDDLVKPRAIGFTFGKE